MDYRLIVMGLSAGGLQALSVLLPALPANFSLPIAIVQHRSRDSHALATVLQEDSRLRVCEIEDKMPLDYAQVYLAPPDYHALVEDGYFALSTEAPVTYSRPSIDVFFESAADQLGPAVIGVVLTGANRDGRSDSRASDRAGGQPSCRTRRQRKSPSCRAPLWKPCPEHVCCRCRRLRIASLRWRTMGTPRARGGHHRVDTLPGILLVDDRPENLLALEAMLEPLGQDADPRDSRRGGAAQAAVGTSSR